MTVALVSAIVSVVVSVVGAINGADVDGAISSANQRSSATAATTKNAARDAANKNTQAQNSLKRFIQATNNNRALDAGGASLAANVTTYRRQKDQLLNSNFETSIQTAEQMGSQASSAALSGITGSVVDNINATTALKRDRVAANVDEQGRAVDQNFADRQRGIVSSTIDGLDNRGINDVLDNNIDVALKYASPSWFGKFLSGGGGQSLAKLGGSFASMGGSGDNGMGLGNGNTYVSGDSSLANGYAQGRD